MNPLWLRLVATSKPGTAASPAMAGGGARATDGPAPAPQAVGDVLRSGRGRPLDASARAYFEPRFGRDLNGVRVHDDAHADVSARSVSALAYTVGQDMVFRRGAFSPETSDGRRLLAHELAHVAQQGEGTSRSAVSGPLLVAPTAHPAEREADRMADAVLGRSARASPSSLGLGRDPLEKVGPEAHGPTKGRARDSSGPRIGGASEAPRTAPHLLHRQPSPGDAPLCPFGQYRLLPELPCTSMYDSPGAPGSGLRLEPPVVTPPWLGPGFSPLGQLRLGSGFPPLGQLRLGQEPAPLGPLQLTPELASLGLGPDFAQLQIELFKWRLLGDAFGADTTTTPTKVGATTTYAPSKADVVLVKESAEKKLAEVKESPDTYVRAILAKAGLDADTWLKSFTKATFLGQNITEPIHTDLATHLAKVEKTFASTYGGPTKSPAEAGKALGLVEAIGGSRTYPTSAPLSMHLFGLALDINYTTNPFVSTSANPAFLRAGQLVNGVNTAVYKDGMSYAELSGLDATLETYFSYLDNPSALEARLKAASGPPWKDKSADDARKVIEADLTLVSEKWERTKDKETLKKSGFLNLKKELIDGIGLSWGGSYGDMMHFDMRNTGNGAKISSAINQYKAALQKAAGDKWTKEHP